MGEKVESMWRVYSFHMDLEFLDILMKGYFDLRTKLCQFCLRCFQIFLFKSGCYFFSGDAEPGSVTPEKSKLFIL